MRRHAATLLKLGLVALLLTFLAKKGLLSVGDLRKILHFPVGVGLALAATGINLMLCIWRWQILLRAQGVTLTWTSAARLTLIGNFFNLALPGAVSGDLVKAFYIAREHPGKRGHVFGSILFDRVVGVSGLVMVASAALIFGFGTGTGANPFSRVEPFVIFSFLSMTAFYLCLFLVPDSRDPLLWLFRKMQGKLPAASSLTRVYEGVRNYHPHRGMVGLSLAISCLVHFLAASACLIFFQVLDGPMAHGGPSNVWAIYVAVPLGLLVTAVPVAPAGVGTGHAAFSWLFLLLGSHAGANIFSLHVLFQLLFGALGGLVYLRYRSSHQHDSGYSKAE
jgi:uncharacterized membrane protein YbhN (UPF0104 family)